MRTSSVLAVPGQARNQTVAADEQADHHLLQHLFLAHDHAPHLRHDLALHLAEALDPRFENFRLQLLVTVDMFCPFPSS